MSTFERLQTIIGEYMFTDPESVVEDASFIDDLGFDSLDAVEFLMAVEEEFGIEVDDEQAEKVIIVRDAVRLIDRAVAS